MLDLHVKGSLGGSSDPIFSHITVNHGAQNHHQRVHHAQRQILQQKQP